MSEKTSHAAPSRRDGGMKIRDFCRHFFAGSVDGNGKIPNAVLPVLLIVVTVIANVLYQAVSASRVRERVFGVLTDSQAEQVSTLRTKLEGQYAILNIFAAEIEDSDLIGTDELRRRMKDITEIGEFEHIFFAGRSGAAFAESGAFDISDREYFKRSMAGNNALQKVKENRVDKRPMIVLSAPINRFGGCIGVICAGYSEQEMRKLLISRAFGSNSYSVICSSTGDIIIGGENGELGDVKNIFDALGDARFKTGSFADFTDGIRMGREGITVYTSGGETLYATYMSASVNDWRIINFLPETYVTGEIRAGTKSGILLTLFLLLAACLVVVFIIVTTGERVRAASREAELNRQLSVYRLDRKHGAFSLAYDGVFSLTYANDSFFELVGYTREYFEKHCRYEIFGFVEESEREGVRARLEKLFAGKKSRDEWTMHILGKNGERTAVSVLACAVRDDNDIVDAVSGTMSDCSEAERLAEELAEAKRELSLSDGRLRAVAAIAGTDVYEYDLRTRTVIQLYTEGFDGKPIVTADVPYSRVDSGAVHPDDADRYIDMYEQLFEGVRFTEGVFRTRDNDGSYRREHIRLTAIRDGDGRNVKAMGISTVADELVQ